MALPLSSIAGQLLSALTLYQWHSTREKISIDQYNRLNYPIDFYWQQCHKGSKVNLRHQPLSDCFGIHTITKERNFPDLVYYKLGQTSCNNRSSVRYVKFR